MLRFTGATLANGGGGRGMIMRRRERELGGHIGLCSAVLNAWAGWVAARGAHEHRDTMLIYEQTII